MKPAVKKKSAEARAWWYELIVLPAVLVVAGTVILRLTDGVWWGIAVGYAGSVIPALLYYFWGLWRRKALASWRSHRPGSVRPA